MTTNPSPTFTNINTVNETVTNALTALNVAVTNTLTAANVVATASLSVIGNETVGGTLGVTGAASVGALTVGGVPYSYTSGTNRIINGNFLVNQRVQVSNIAIAAGLWGHDRWKAGVGGCTYTFTQVVPDTMALITTGTLTQVIEAYWIEGGVYTLSWTGTAQARVYQGAPAGTYAVSPIVTTSLGAGANTIVEFNPGTLGKVKFELGPVATVFNRDSPSKVLLDCQRYTEKFGGGNPGGSDLMFQANVTAAGLNFTTTLSYHTTMRAIPTITIIGNFVKSNLANGGVPLFFAGVDSMALLFSATAAGLVNWANNDATSYIILNAEI